ncbi:MULTISPECIES: hypothetical protein [Streptomyces]|uniref:Uncharacterized protein n=2 Tax=Streptomyces rimosus subsp. rimosus TaxID=132474 RepID=L8ENW4_STRR1|nr:MULTISPECIES: hypothetical protein [Streptomyces]KOG75616.1 DNA polymerase III subunit beta [Kitasatospora aureofaciens]MYT40943.1 hypothetical protein [Streptomyces sp. SID5471]KUJ39356.1 DNA polymerase III subunit beta [Streptomyces rimosus subsp. rimosus]QDA08844.1 hypothetical protein CTZ40_38990 [Streptomyces rimosus]QEV80121.1 hypothetical protein CP984_38945 [Streptomyces rimosus]
MILSEEYLQNLLDKTLPQIRATDGCAVVLEGSIAEGFGNSSSDIDFLLIADGDADLPTMPSLLFVDGRRVEVRTRSVRQIAEQFAAVTAAAANGPGAEDLLNRCQRLLRSFPLREPELVAKVKDLMSFDDFRTTVGEWWARAARQSIRYALALRQLGQEQEAAAWTEAGLLQAVKSWAAGRGETYLEPKWLPEQLGRIGDHPPAARYLTLASPSASGLGADAYVTEGVRLAADLGVTGATPEAGRITVAGAGVTTWQTGERVHVVRGRQDVFVLGDRAARAWRSLVFGRTLEQTLAAADAAGAPQAGPLIAEFLRYGLVRVAWQGDGPIVPGLPLAAPAGDVTPPPSTARPIIAVGGATAGGAEAIDLLPVPARRFSAAAMTLVWSNVLVENAREDLVGALDRGQWSVAQLSALRMLRFALRGVLSSYAVNPLPPDSEVVRRLSLLPDGDDLDAIRARAGQLDTLTIASGPQGDAALTALDDFVALVRRATGADRFPSSFDSPDAWRQTLEAGNDWLRLGAHLDADLPIDEAGDLLSSGGAQPHAASA